MAVDWRVIYLFYRHVGSMPSLDSQNWPLSIMLNFCFKQTWTSVRALLPRSPKRVQSCVGLTHGVEAHPTEVGISKLGFPLFFVMKRANPAAGFFPRMTGVVYSHCRTFGFTNSTTLSQFLIPQLLSYISSGYFFHLCGIIICTWSCFSFFLCTWSMPVACILPNFHNLRV